MLFGNEITKKSLSDFLHLDCLLDVDWEDVKEKFSYFLIKDTQENREKIFSHIPENFFTECTNQEKYLKITKADLLRYQKVQMHNPIRTWGNDDEYSTRLITSLLFQATPQYNEYCMNLYKHGQDKYIHDQRAGSGRAKQFLNWMYSDEGYPGRLEEKNEYEKLIPLCFPNPELLRKHFSFLGGQYVLNISDDWKNSILYKTLNDSNLLNEFAIQEKDDQKKTIRAPFYTWQKVITEILKQKDLEKQLSQEQQKAHIVSLIIEFIKNKEGIQNVKTLQEKVQGFIQSISNQEDSTQLNDDRTAVQNAINALHKIRQNIAANKEFFDKFTNDMGVLQAEQYFRALTAQIDSEITFLDVFQNKLTEDDLSIFLNQTCKEVHSDINELLLAHDFFLTDSLENRDMVINLTRGEVKELYQYISDKIKVCSIEDKKEKNQWLLKQLELHPLFELFSIKNTDAASELWEIVKGNDALNNKEDILNFVDKLKKIVNPSDDKNKMHIELSRWLAFKQGLYNISRNIPLSSIWLSHVNPSKSRTGTKYKGSILKEKLYTKNRVIPASEFSQSIRKNLNLSTENEEFVASKHEATWLTKEFRKKHGISGAREKVLTYLGKNKVLWYTLLSVFILLTSAAAIAGRVLSYLGIIPPVVVDKMINSLRGIFDGFVIMFGLDTIIDSIFILAVDFAGIVVRVVDFILLFGLISTTIRYITKGIGKIVDRISDGFKSIYETIRVYGLKGSLILLHDKIIKNEEPKENLSEIIEQKAKEKKDIIIGGERNINNISSAIQSLLQEAKEKGFQSSSERGKYVFNNLRSLIEANLICRDVKLSVLFNNFSNIHNLFKSTTDWSFVKFQYEFQYLLNKHPEKFSVNNKPEQNDVTAQNHRMKMYDVMAAVSLQTKLVPEEKRKLITSIGAKKIIEKINKEKKGEIDPAILNKKIAAIDWAIDRIRNCGIYPAIEKAEPVFQVTKAHMSAEIALCDYSEKLKELHNNKEGVSVDELNAYEMIFSQYIANTHHILNSIDKFTAKNHEGSSLHKFREAFDSLKPPSHEAENAALILGIERGGVSIFSRTKEYVTDFVSEFQDPKVFAAAFAVYYIAIEIPYLLDAAQAITGAPEEILESLGLGMVHDHFIETDVGRILIETLYEKGELLKDVWVLLNEFKDGVIGETEMKKRWSEVKHMVKKTKSCNHHDHGSAKERLISFINNLVHFICTILLINFFKSLFSKLETQYRTFAFFEQEEQRDDSTATERTEPKRVIDEGMYNLPEIPSYLTSLKPEYLEDCIAKSLGNANLSICNSSPTA